MSSITIDARMINSSGIGRYLQNIIPFLIDEFSLNLIGLKDELSQFEWSKKITIIPCDVPIYSIKEQFELPKIIPECDLFWSPHFVTPILPIKAKKRIVTIHDCFHLAMIKNLSLFEKIYAKVFYNAAVKISDSIITVSNFSAQELVKYTFATPDKIHVIHSGVTNLLSSKKSSQEIKGKYHLPEDYLLVVGNVKPHKNILTLVKAIHMNSIKGIHNNLMIVGKKEGFINGDSELLNYIDQNQLNDKIFFTGFVEDTDLRNIYSHASIFCFPSLYEGFGFPPLEAMSCGTATLTSNAASLPEACGDATVYFNPNNTEELALKIKDLQFDTKRKVELIIKGHEQVKKYNWEMCVDKHKTLFRLLTNFS